MAESKEPQLPIETILNKLLDYRRRVGAINFQLEKLDDYLHLIQVWLDTVDTIKSGSCELMTWHGFKKYVDKALADLGSDDSMMLWFIDVCYPIATQLAVGVDANACYIQ